MRRRAAERQAQDRAAVVVLVAAACLGGDIPARRATKVDPLLALRAR